MKDYKASLDMGGIPLAATNPVPSFIEEETSSITTPPPPGTFSPKLLEFIRNIVHHQKQSSQQVQSQRSSRKHHNFRLEDLCLIHRVETELRRAFGLPGSPITLWTPSTSLLKPLSSPTNEEELELGRKRYWIRGLPLALNGFQRMLIHATATYLGLRSFSKFKTVNICPLGEYLGALLNSKYSLNRCFFRLMQMLFIVKLSA